MRIGIVAGIFASLAAVSLLATTSSSLAQSAPLPQTTDSPEPLAMEEVVVNARRQSEVLQDVPQALSVVDADVINNLKILKFEDVQAAVPGLSLSSGGNGYNTSASMRGVTFDPTSRTSPTVEFYMNDALVESNFLFQSMFDIQQVEVLRGPQGTLRGRAAPSGAITVTTKEADVSAMGGYVSATTSNIDSHNVQAAVNIPIVAEQLALRIAGVWDRNDFDGVNSVHSDKDPEAKTNAYRTSLRFEPNDEIDASLMYQHLRKQLTSFVSVTGAGAAATDSHAAGYNGPVIDSGDRLAITDGANQVDQVFDVAIAQANWEMGSQLVSYVGSFSKWDSDAYDPLDDGNLLPGAELFQHQEFVNKRTTHELRLSSLEPVFDRLDYTVGAFYSRQTIDAKSPLPFAYLSGAFGSPLAEPSPYAYNPRYVLWGLPSLPTTEQETSLFANVTWHLNDDTDVAIGGRYIRFKAQSLLKADVQPGFMALPSAGPCNVGSSYAGTCDLAIDAIQNVIYMKAPDVDEKPFVYNATLSHHFDADLMAYATVGTSWRKGVDASAGINNGTENAQLRDLTLVDPEKSRTYEIGFKWAFLDNRGRMNAAIYHQTFDGLIFQPPSVPYLSYTTASATPTVVQKQFAANADAKIDGVDFDVAFMVTPSWSIASAFSYSDGQVDNDNVPCRDSNGDGVADSSNVFVNSFAAGSVIAFCKSDMSVSMAPDWNANLQSEYTIPLAAGFDVYLRGLYTYYPENRNRNEGFTVDSYGLLNVYVGLRDIDGVWDLSLFARNALNEGTTLSKDPYAVQSDGDIDATFGPSGYYVTSYTPRREVGLSIRYSFDQ